MCSHCSGAAIGPTPAHKHFLHSRQAQAHRQANTPSLQHTLHGFLLTNNPPTYTFRLLCSYNSYRHYSVGTCLNTPFHIDYLRRKAKLPVRDSIYHTVLPSAQALAAVSKSVVMTVSLGRHARPTIPPQYIQVKQIN